MSETEAKQGHGGVHAVDVARAHGVETLFTLSGAHVFPMYDGAVKAELPMPIIDVRHEPSAVFAAEAIGKLTRKPGLAVLTAGPGVTNAVSPVAQANFSGSPLVVIGGRAPAGRWGTGSLQELDHPPIFQTISKSAKTAHLVEDIAPTVDEAFNLAGSSHRGPTFLDVPMDQFFSFTTVTEQSRGNTVATIAPDVDALGRIASLLAGSSRPVLIIGTDVWADGAEVAALRFVEESGIPV
ncbi:MAG: thiamine pyrophosphate-binding protein, partial [Aeromicrobium sp.]